MPMARSSSVVLDLNFSRISASVGTTLARGGSRAAGGTLSYGYLEHYRKVVTTLSETIRLMVGIDSAIPQWPVESRRVSSLYFR